MGKVPNDESSRTVKIGPSGVVSRKLPSPEIKQPLILEKEISSEELTRGSGGSRPDSSNIFMSPSSKKVIKESRSVSSAKIKSVINTHYSRTKVKIGAIN